MNNDFNPNRLKSARLRRGLTIKSLAENIGRTSRTVSSYENAREEPPETILSRLANTLNYPIAFFYADDLDELDTNSVSFRALSKMTAAQRNIAVTAGQIAVVFNTWLEQQLNLPKTNVPEYRDLSPSAAANAIRQEWGLGELSIPNMIHLLESNGIKVFSLFHNSKAIDAFSFWKGETPYIFLNHQKSGERSRFDAAHELGHLILHKHAKPQGREAECQADSFASALLMPEGAVRGKAMYMPSIGSIVALKKHWKVSAAALVRRMKDLGLISDWHYQKINIRMSQIGMLKKEPLGIEHETSILLEKVFKLLWSQGMTRERISELLFLPTSDLDDLVFGLSRNSTPLNEAKPKKLTIVK